LLTLYRSGDEADMRCWVEAGTCASRRPPTWGRAFVQRWHGDIQASANWRQEPTQRS